MKNIHLYIVIVVLIFWSWIVSKYDVGAYLQMCGSGRTLQIGNHWASEKLTWGEAYDVYAFEKYGLPNGAVMSDEDRLRQAKRRAGYE